MFWRNFPMFWSQLIYTALSIKPCFRLDLCALPLSDTSRSSPLSPDSLESVLVISWYPNTCPSEAPGLFSLYSSGGRRPFAWLHCQSCPACYQDVILLFLLPHNYLFWSPSPFLSWASPRHGPSLGFYLFCNCCWHLALLTPSYTVYDHHSLPRAKLSVNCLKLHCPKSSKYTCCSFQKACRTLF